MQLLIKRCLFCGDNEKLIDLYKKNFDEKDLTPQIFSARRATEHFHYRMVRCLKCGLVFSREVLPNSSLLPLYSESHVTFEKQIPIIRKDYWRHLKPFVEQRRLKSALEIGCSSGFFLEELKVHGFEVVYGCEPSLEAKNKANPSIRDFIFQGFFREGLYQNNSFDLICSFQTLDHLSDPLEVLRISRNILKPGGLMYFVCHDVDAWQARILKEKSPIIDIEHIYLFNKKTLPHLFEKMGFDVIKVGDIKNSYPLEYWLKMLPMSSSAKFFLNGITKITGLGRAAIPLAAGNIFIVAESGKST